MVSLCDLCDLCGKKEWMDFLGDLCGEEKNIECRSLNRGVVQSMRAICNLQSEMV